MDTLTQNMDAAREDFDGAACLTDGDFDFSCSPSPTPRFETPSSPAEDDDNALAQVFDDSAFRDVADTSSVPTSTSSEPQRACLQALRAISMDDPFAVVKKRLVAAIFNSQGEVSVDDIACFTWSESAPTSTLPLQPQPALRPVVSPMDVDTSGQDDHFSETQPEYYLLSPASSMVSLEDDTFTLNATAVGVTA
eukprot:1459181-Rhodomonas_salina.1